MQVKSVGKLSNKKDANSRDLKLLGEINIRLE